MKMVITEEMVNGFNDILQKENSIIRLKLIDNAVKIGLISDYLIDNYTLNVSHIFYHRLETYFKNLGINKLSYNNTGSWFWKFE
jgi:hypothetical protein